ncbi:hypothetical protein B6A10_04820 [Flavobacterium sp. L1I52]|uniref:Lipoprotein n=1 Tax=Flavobacterium pokkalii TaxID=1940408 RepID=A0ABR7UNU1_9FLAO|nr:hypothetical protein [Flavobacterium pokkalii]MBD0724496.1 hypothetical protein [Flavobacterium pokkalii]
MKKTFYIITLLLINICSISCSNDDDLNYQNDFEKSKSAWLDFKASSNNSYQYVVSGSSFVLPSHWEITITVSNGIVIRRDFTYINAPESISEEEKNWTENENEINTHSSFIAASPITLDEIYTKAEKDWLIKRKNTSTYFETENNGLISTCGYTEKNCMDDCFIGIKIKSITSL